MPVTPRLLLMSVLLSAALGRCTPAPDPGAAPSTRTIASAGAVATSPPPTTAAVPITTPAPPAPAVASAPSGTPVHTLGDPHDHLAGAHSALHDGEGKPTPPLALASRVEPVGPDLWEVTFELVARREHDSVTIEWMAAPTAVLLDGDATRTIGPIKAQTPITLQWTLRTSPKTRELGLVGVALATGGGAPLRQTHRLVVPDALPVTTGRSAPKVLPLPNGDAAIVHDL